MPKAVLLFERLYLVAFALVIGSAILNWSDVSATVFPIVLLQSAFYVAMALLVSRKRSWIALAILVVANFDNVRSALILPTEVLGELFDATAILINAIPLVAFACLLTPSGRAWLSKKKDKIATA